MAAVHVSTRAGRSSKAPAPACAAGSGCCAAADGRLQVTLQRDAAVPLRGGSRPGRSRTARIQRLRWNLARAGRRSAPPRGHAVSGERRRGEHAQHQTPARPTDDHARRTPTRLPHHPDDQAPSTAATNTSPRRALAPRGRVSAEEAGDGVLTTRRLSSAATPIACASAGFGDRQRAEGVRSAGRRIVSGPKPREQARAGERLEQRPELGTPPGADLLRRRRAGRSRSRRPASTSRNSSASEGNRIRPPPSTATITTRRACRAARRPAARSARQQDRALRERPAGDHGGDGERGAVARRLEASRRDELERRERRRARRRSRATSADPLQQARGRGGARRSAARRARRARGRRRGGRPARECAGRDALSCSPAPRARRRVGGHEHGGEVGAGRDRERADEERRRVEPARDQVAGGVADGHAAARRSRRSPCRARTA